MKYLEIEFQNIAPLRIANDAASQNGQADTLSYIPGSAIRGAVIHALCQKAYFPQLKRALFSEHIHFMNAYLKREGKTLIPSLKGFCEDWAPREGEKEIENALATQKAAPGAKQADLGRYCYPEQDTVYYGDVAYGVDRNINRGRKEEKEMFQSRYIQKGQSFVGYITWNDRLGEVFGEEIRQAYSGRPEGEGNPLDALAEELRKVFTGVLSFGNSRHSGYGACRCVRAEAKEGIPYGQLRSKKNRGRFYLVLLSHMTMRNAYGEPSGLVLEELAKRLGSKALRVVCCAASLVEVQGYNRSWKGAIPSVPMYEAGSVFCIETRNRTFIPAGKFRKLEAEGLGIRRNEGFGQVLVFDGYKSLKKKQPLGKAKEAFAYTAKLPAGHLEDVGQDIRIAARGLLASRLERAAEAYVSQKAEKFYGIPGKRLGAVQSLCLELQYAPKEAERQLLEYLRHAEGKEGNQSLRDGKQEEDALYGYVESVLKGDLLERLSLRQENGKLLGMDISEILTKEELCRYKLRLIVAQIRHANREVREYAE